MVLSLKHNIKPNKHVENAWEQEHKAQNSYNHAQLVEEKVSPLLMVTCGANPISLKEFAHIAGVLEKLSTKFVNLVMEEEYSIKLKLFK
jgi:hypothetical protein